MGARRDRSNGHRRRAAEISGLAELLDSWLR